MPKFKGDLGACHVDHNMNAAMPYVHYSNPRWNTPQTIWGGEEEGVQYEYSDRLWQYDSKKAEIASKKATKRAGEAFTPKRIQAFLTAYFGQAVELRHILAGVNTSGYTYYVYGFRFKKAGKK